MAIHVIRLDKAVFGERAMQTSSKNFIDYLIKNPAASTRLAAGEILRLREGIHDAIEALRAGRDAEFCARRLEMLLGLRRSLNRTPSRGRSTTAGRRPTQKPNRAKATGEEVIGEASTHRAARKNLRSPTSDPTPRSRKKRVRRSTK